MGMASVAAKGMNGRGSSAHPGVATRSLERLIGKTRAIQRKARSQYEAPSAPLSEE